MYNLTTAQGFRFATPPNPREAGKSLEMSASEHPMVRFVLLLPLEDAPPHVSMEPERLDLTQIDFVLVIRARLLAAGEKAGVRVLSTARRCADPEGFTLHHAGTSVLIQDATSDE